MNHLKHSASRNCCALLPRGSRDIGDKIRTAHLWTKMTVDADRSVLFMLNRRDFPQIGGLVQPALGLTLRANVVRV